MSELAARAEAGEEIVLTRGDAPSVRLVIEGRKPERLDGPANFDELGVSGASATASDREEVRQRRRRVLEEFRGVLKGQPGMEGVTAANIADDLYDEDGLPA
ncbi:type II toxin-antitoxin system Phd/YefM family antitoxin [uncultured Sphingomonas sp.]|uniref:type II toxin-antitoxin system Phd/YefM family antitoxin n=1 Tax=uncultured Sphingomonas sp. TaxID=158754 RepID=UPI0035CB4A93